MQIKFIGAIIIMKFKVWTLMVSCLLMLVFPFVNIQNANSKSSNSQLVIETKSPEGKKSSTKVKVGGAAGTVAKSFAFRHVLGTVLITIASVAAIIGGGFLVVKNYREGTLGQFIGDVVGSMFGAFCRSQSNTNIHVSVF